MYDRITDHYAAALQIAQSPHYAMKLGFYDLMECISVIEKQVSRMKSEDLAVAYLNKLQPGSIQTAAIKTLETARGIIQDEIEKRNTSEREQIEQAPGLPEITQNDIAFFYRVLEWDSIGLPQMPPDGKTKREHHTERANRHGLTSGKSQETAYNKKRPVESDRKGLFIESLTREKFKRMLNQLEDNQSDLAPIIEKARIFLGIDFW
jgi:hypothetical protein